MWCASIKTVPCSRIDRFKLNSESTIASGPSPVQGCHNLLANNPEEFTLNPAMNVLYFMGIRW